jgi:hypothetical protein
VLDASGDEHNPAGPNLNRLFVDLRTEPTGQDVNETVLVGVRMQRTG